MMVKRRVNRRRVIFNIWVVLALILVMDGVGITYRGIIYSRESSVPVWTESLPLSINSYYFVGIGTGRTKDKAKDDAIKDALSQIILMINTSITTNNSFSLRYSEKNRNNKRNSFSSLEGGYKTIEVKGSHTIQNFEVKKIYFSPERSSGMTAYILGKVPKLVIEEAIEKIKLLREEVSKYKTGIISLTINKYANKIDYNEILQGFLEQFYLSQGYNVVPLKIDLDLLNIKDGQESIIKGIQDQTKGKAEKLIYASIYSKNFQKIIANSSIFYSIIGILTLRKVNINNNKIEYLKQFHDKALSNSLDKSFNNLEMKLINNFLKIENKKYPKIDYLNY